MQHPDPVEFYKKEIDRLNRILHEKNILLDLLGYVWCSGGCDTGVHRYHPTLELTEEQVQMIERNTQRLRQWFDNNRCHKAQETNTQTKHCTTCNVDKCTQHPQYQPPDLAGKKEEMKK